MGTPITPSADAPIDPSRIKFGHDEKSGLFSGDTESREDPSGKQPKVPVQEAIGKVSATVEASGPVTAEVDAGTNTAQVHSSWVKMNADVTLKPNVDPDPANFKIGWTQTLVSSRRNGIYKNAKGEVKGKLTTIEHAPDRRSYLVPYGKESRQITVAKPWYDLPEEMSAIHRHIQTHAFDRPKHPLPLTSDDGSKLVGMKGGESFLTSLKAGNEGEITLQTWQWQIPWDIDLEGITSSAPKTGGNATSSETKEANPNLDGRTAVQQAGNAAFETYETASAAAAALANLGYSSFVSMLDKHKQQAPSSYWNMVDALWHSDAQLRVQVVKGKEAVAKGVTVGFGADNTFTANQSGSVFTMLAHMVIDPGKLGTPLKITVNGTAVMTVAPPYYGATENATVTLPGAWYGTNEDPVAVKFSIR